MIIMIINYIIMGPTTLFYLLRPLCYIIQRSPIELQGISFKGTGLSENFC